VARIFAEENGTWGDGEGRGGDKGIEELVLSFAL
jgi:hypothetical protein